MIGAKQSAAPALSQQRQRGEPALRVDGLARAGVLHDISFTLHRGEVIALWGLLGSGRTELARLLFGLDRSDSGELHVAGVLKDKTLIVPPDLSFGYCRLQLHDVGVSTVSLYPVKKIDTDYFDEGV